MERNYLISIIKVSDEGRNAMTHSVTPAMRLL